MNHALTIFWHHVGREHGGMSYAPDIRKNTPEIIARHVEAKRQWSLRLENRNQFERYDETTLLELPAEGSKHNFVIVYCLDRGLQFSLNCKQQYPWWLVDIVDIDEYLPNTYCVHDLFIDVAVFPDGRYHVLDLADFQKAVELDVLSKEQVAQALRSLSDLLCELNGTQFPNALLREIEGRYRSAGLQR